jgi:hypothetical protein
MPSLNPVGHHSTRLKEVLAFREATAALQSRGTTSPDCCVSMGFWILRSQVLETVLMTCLKSLVTIDIPL